MAEIVDGNNVIGRLGGGTREGLVEALASLCRARGKSLVVVFDGPPATGRQKVQQLGALTVVCAAPRTADEEILERVRSSRERKGVCVVTDDRALASAVREAGASWRTVADLRREAAERLSRPAGAAGGMVRGTPVAPSGKPALPGKASEWERWLSDEGNRIR